MSIISSADVGGADLPQIDYSLRFDGSDDYLSRTPANPVVNDKWTQSFWVKRGKLGFQAFGGSGTVGVNSFTFHFNADDKLEAYYPNTGSILWVITDASFRDMSTWYHIVIKCDLANSTPANRWQFWVNGVRQVTPTNNFSGALNYNVSNPVWFMNHPAYGGVQDGYIANYCFVDQQIKEATDFAYTDPNGQWRSLAGSTLKALADAGGTNSFFLDFSNFGSLGQDKSSKGNNWTLNNFPIDKSLCQMTDTPTNNFATLNPLDFNSSVTLSNGALSCSIAASGLGYPSSTVQMSSGKWYWEITDGGTNNVFGVAPHDASLTSYLFAANGGYGYYGSGQKYVNGVASGYGAPFASGDVIGVALNVDTNEITFYKNGAPQPTLSITSGKTWKVCGGNGTSGNASTAAYNFGQRTFAHPATWVTLQAAGFKTLCTKNLPEGSVTTSGTFTGNTSLDGPFTWLNGTPTAMTINGNPVTFGTHVDKLANGFKVRSSSASYNASGSNTFSVTTNSGVFKYNNAEGNP